MKAKSATQTGKILLAIDKSFGLSFAGVCTRTGEPRDVVRKALHYLHKEGRVSRKTDDNGIVTYKTTPQGQAWLKGESTSVIKPSVAPKAQEIPPVEKTEWKPSASRNEAWAHLIEEAEQRGFAKGYSVGVQEAQRAAYEQGKAHAARKLVELIT